jgi:hypothetical protein
MRRMIAKKAFSYRGASLEVGDEFDADKEHVELFTTIGHACLKPVNGYETRVMDAGRGRMKKRHSRVTH